MYIKSTEISRQIIQFSDIFEDKEAAYKEVADLGSSIQTVGIINI